MSGSRRVQIARQGLEELGDSFVTPPYEGTVTLKVIMRVNSAAFMVSVLLGCLAGPGSELMDLLPLLLLGLAFLAQFPLLIMFIEKPWIRWLLVTSSGQVLFGSGASICLYAGFTLARCVSELSISPWFESSFGQINSWLAIAAATVLGPLSALALFASTFFVVRSYRRNARGRCRSCGYPIGNNESERCSECGKSFDDPDEARTPLTVLGATR